MMKFLALLLALILSTGSTVAEDECQEFKITTKRDDDRVEVRTEQGKTLITIHSPFGISQTHIERTQSNWSETVTLRLHLRGLEKFSITNGRSTLHAAVSHHGDNKPVRLWRDDQENSPLDSHDPYWMEIQMIGNDGKPVTSIPLKDGYFEMRLPKKFLQDNPQSITANWIDFYR